MTPLSIVARDIVQVGSVCGYDYTASSADDLLRNIEHALQWCELDYTTRLRLEGYVEELRGGLSPSLGQDFLFFFKRGTKAGC